MRLLRSQAVWTGGLWQRLAGGQRVSVEIPGDGTLVITIAASPRAQLFVPGDGTIELRIT